MIGASNVYISCVYLPKPPPHKLVGNVCVCTYIVLVLSLQCGIQQDHLLRGLLTAAQWGLYSKKKLFFLSSYGLASVGL